MQIGTILSYEDIANPRKEWTVVDIDGRWLKIRCEDGDEDIISRHLVEKNQTRGGLAGWRVVTTKGPEAPQWLISIEFSENSALYALSQIGMTWNTFAAFSAVVAGIAHTCPRNGAYDKTAVEVRHLESDETYKCRLDLQHPDRPDPDNDLLEHVKRAVTYYLRNPEKMHVKEDELADALAEWVKWGDRFVKAN